jgi:transcriptional regulator with XRE-family HTH domain
MIARLGTKLRRRERAGLSQTELAQLIGMSERSKGYISEIEGGKKILSTEKILKIALYFNCFD